MKKTVLYLTIVILFQSCHSYKITAVNDLQADTYYEMRMHDEMNVRGVFQKVNNDSLEFRIKHRLLKYSTNDINQIRRKKPAVLKTLSLFAIFTTAAVLSVTTNDVVYAGTIYGTQ